MYSKNDFKFGFKHYLEFLNLKKLIYRIPEFKSGAEIHDDFILVLLENYLDLSKKEIKEFYKHRLKMVNKKKEKKLANEKKQDETDKPQKFNKMPKLNKKEEITNVMFGDVKTKDAKTKDSKEKDTKTKDTKTPTDSKTKTNAPNKLLETEEDWEVDDLETIEKENYDYMKIILISLYFSKAEFIQLFMEYVHDFDDEGDYRYSMDEIIKIIETFSHADFVGQAKMAKLLREKRIKVEKGILSIFKGEEKKLTFGEDTYKDLFYVLTGEGYEHVTFETFMPFLYLFFLSKE